MDVRGVMFHAAFIPLPITTHQSCAPQLRPRINHYGMPCGGFDIIMPFGGRFVEDGSQPNSVSDEILTTVCQHQILVNLFLHRIHHLILYRMYCALPCR